MKLVQAAIAGTVESSDVLVTVEPADTLTVELNSNVKKQFGASITATVLSVAQELDITGAKITLEDKGALDCTIKARTATALKRAMADKEVK